MHRERAGTLRVDPARETGVVMGLTLGLRGAPRDVDATDRAVTHVDDDYVGEFLS
jgi:hypothetical protein